MSAFLNVIKKDYHFTLQTFRDDIKQRKDKEFFRPTGTQVYCGRQGSGKTISGVAHLIKLKRRYPRAIIVTNLSLTGLEPLEFRSEARLKYALANIDPAKQYIMFHDADMLALALVGVNNGKYGVIYFIDEIHTYFNALESKNIPMFVFTEISQQRKQRKLIIGTSQLFMRMAKPLREQCDNLIVCDTILGVITRQRAYDGMTLEQDYDGSLVGTVRKIGFFVHTPEIRSAFDTYQKVVSATEQYEQIQRPVVFEQKRNQKIDIKYAR